MTFGGKQKLSLQHRMQSHLEHYSNMFCTADGGRIYGGTNAKCTGEKSNHFAAIISSLHFKTSQNYTQKNQQQRLFS
jgi:hypothetical protein